jgi:hypothetical protein
MIIVCDVNNHIIVQSEVVFTTCEVINIFLFILGLWSLSLIIASYVKLCAIGSEHRPYSERLHCQPLCFSVVTFGSPFSLTFEYNYVRCCSSNSAAIHAGLWEEIQRRSLLSNSHYGPTVLFFVSWISFPPVFIAYKLASLLTGTMLLWYYFLSTELHFLVDPLLAHSRCPFAYEISLWIIAIYLIGYDLMFYALGAALAICQFRWCVPHCLWSDFSAFAIFPLL